MTQDGTSRAPLLAVDRLRIEYRNGGRVLIAVDSVSLTIDHGESVGIVGESGSGKSTLARALVGLLPRRSANVGAAQIHIDGKLIRTERLHTLRGSTVAMVFQDPLSYLNPLMTVRQQLTEAIALHDRQSSAHQREQELLEQVQLNPSVSAMYPHELSGGMRQRVLLAIALACRPRLLIADEPTTALDVTTQREILNLIDRLRRDTGMALLLISHDLGVVSTLCGHVHVMRMGKTVEQGPIERIFSAPSEPYTQHLLAAACGLRDNDGRFLTLSSTSPPSTRPDIATSTVPNQSEAEREAILTVSGVGKTYAKRTGERLRAVHAVDLIVRRGETVALVGESGSGKSTLARIALGLIRPDEGAVYLNGQHLQALTRVELRRERIAMQPVFQDASGAFNPRRTILQILTQALRASSASAAVPQDAARLLEEVGLSPGTDFLHRYPHELSGGQRQRVSIARALAVQPALVIADEPLSGADVSIRGQVLNLLQDLQRKRHLAYLFVTHDISLARVFAHRVAVMYRGEIVEQGLATEVLEKPAHPYTKRLISATLSPQAYDAFPEPGSPIAEPGVPIPVY